MVVLSEWLYAEVSLAAGASAPLDPEAEERSIYVVEGEVNIAGETFDGRGSSSFVRTTGLPCGQRAPCERYFLAARHWRAHATSGGILFPRARSGSSKRKRN